MQARNKEPKKEQDENRIENDQEPGTGTESGRRPRLCGRPRYQGRSPRRIGRWACRRGAGCVLVNASAHITRVPTWSREITRASMRCRVKCSLASKCLLRFVLTGLCASWMEPELSPLRKMDGAESRRGTQRWRMVVAMAEATPAEGGKTPRSQRRPRRWTASQDAE